MSRHPPALRQLAMDRRLGALAVRVYGYVADSLDLVDQRPVKLHSVATALGTKRHHVGRALALLVKLGYLVRGDRAWPGGPYNYRMAYSVAVPEETPA